MSRPDGEYNLGRHNVSPDMIGKSTGRREFDIATGFLLAAGAGAGFSFVTRAAFHAWRDRRKR